MITDRALQTASTILGPWAKDMQLPQLHRLDVVVAAEDLLETVAWLNRARWGTLTAITGLDLGAEAGEIEVLYHFCSGPSLLTLRVRTPRQAPAVPSICSLIPSASLFERELSEMLGVTVVGTPDPSRFLLPDDWPEGVYPLRKDFGVQQAMEDM